MPRRWSRIIITLLACGCAFNRQADRLGHSFVMGARTELADTITRRHIRLAIDSALTDLGTSYRSRLWPTVDTTLHRVAAFGDSTIAGARDSLAAALQGRLSGALDSLVRSNLRAAGDEGRAQMALLSHQLRWQVDHELAPSLERSVQTATRTFMHELSEGLRTDLQVAAESALAAVVRSGVRSGDRAVQRSPVGKTVAWIAGGLVVALFALAIAWLVRDRRRHRGALELVMGEVARHGDPQLAAAVDRVVAPRGLRTRP